MDRPTPEQLAELAAAYQRGMRAFAVPEPISHSDWARKHFYISAESSYGESVWVPWPFQTGLMNLIACDDVEIVSVRKSQRVGYTKILLSDIGYTAHHKRRNQALWQPSDDDAKEFVKAELDTMLRDVAAMRAVMPKVGSRDKGNTLELKRFAGSLLYVKGAKAEGNFRRISVHTARLDEVDKMDRDVEKAGTPVKLALGRTIGAPYPKLVAGSTPKLAGFSHVEDLEREAEIFLRYHMPCPHCGEYHPLSFGGADETHGFKWTDRNPATVRHLCPHCGALIDRADYTAAAEAGRCRWQADDGRWMDDDANFYAADNTPIPHPRRVAAHVWAAYNPNVTWQSIVEEFLEACVELEEGKKEKLKSFKNLTLGETYKEDLEQADSHELRQRAEPYPLGTVPRGGLYVLAAGDTQDNRIEFSAWAFGRGDERWLIDHRIIWGSPADPATWDQVDAYLFETEFPNSFGRRLKIEAACIDSGGHFSTDVYEYGNRRSRRGVRVLRGYSGQERAICQGASIIDYDWKGKTRKNGLKLHSVGTNKAKDHLQAKLEVATPGPGYVHFSDELSDEWFEQFAGEARATRRTVRGDESRWTPTRRRVEAWDCATYATWLSHHLDLHRKGAGFWAAREAKYEPMTDDLFAATPTRELAAQEPAAQQQAAPAPVREAAAPVKQHTTAHTTSNLLQQALKHRRGRALGR